MISINTDGGVDILLDILRQSQTISSNMKSSQRDNTPDAKEANIASFNNSRASLRSPDTDRDIMLSRKGQHRSQRESDAAYYKTKGLIEGILNRMTSLDYRKLSEEGFKAEDLTIEALTLAVQLIKDYDSKGISREKATKKKEEEKKDTDKISEDEIKKRMQAENLPTNNESIERIKVALELSESIPYMDKRDVLYILNNELTPSIENLYKSKFSNQSNEAVTRLSEGEWSRLIPQVSEIISNTSAMVDKDNLKDAKWLIENDIPLTKDSISLLIGLKDLKENYSKDIIFDKILNGMKEGILPGDAVLIEGDRNNIEGLAQNENNIVTEESIAQLVEDVHSINEEDIIRTVETNHDINIKNLIQDRNDDLSSRREKKEGLSPDQQGKLITAKRQLEELRLKMTLEAALRLERKGFHIETEALERVIEKLRIEEKIYYKELYSQARVDSDEASIRLLQLTSETIDEIREIPAHVLGKTLSDRGIQTVSSLLTFGRELTPLLDKAKEAYEALFTVPRAEYGDSIKKAFSNTGSLMEEMGIENTEHNQRAIRILGYNRMEITKEAIEQVKAYDLSVNYLIQNLNPGIALQVIREGVNPLNTPIDELNSRIEILKEQGYSSLDKYSSYLYKLEQNEGLSEAERKAYIGIYRLLYHIDKSDGAALGAVIKSDQEVTLNHLLTALRTYRRGEMDYRINDEFGSLQEASFESESISDQLRAIFYEESHGDIVDGVASTQNEIQRAIIKELLSSMTPERIQALHSSLINMDTRPGEEASKHMDVWETLGNMPTEQLLDYIKGIETAPGEEQTYYYEKLREMQKVYSNSDQAIRFLNNFKLPCTTNNLMMTGQLINNSGTVLKKLFGLKYEDDNEEDEKLQTSLKKKLDLSDTLVDNETMTEAYEQLEQEVKAVIEKEVSEDHIDYNTLTQLKSMGRQINFLTNLAKREFYQIPIEASGKITNINLTIIRGRASGGKVTVTLLSEKLGRIKGEAFIKEGKLSGYIACDNIGSLKLLESLTEPLKSVEQEENITIKQLNFCLQQASDAIYTHQSTGDLVEDRSPETERILYRVAKAMIHMIRSAEEVDSAVA